MLDMCSAFIYVLIINELHDDKVDDFSISRSVYIFSVPVSNSTVNSDLSIIINV